MGQDSRPQPSLKPPAADALLWFTQPAPVQVFALESGQHPFRIPQGQKVSQVVNEKGEVQPLSPGRIAQIFSLAVTKGRQYRLAFVEA